MNRLHNDQRGIAAVEAALGMLILVPLLLVLVEGSRALLEYAQLQNAAMEGARMLGKQQGDPTGVEEYINSLFKNADSSLTVDGAAPTVSIGSRDANNNATVQVDHAFTPLFTQPDGQSGAGLLGITGLDNLTLSAKVVTALPAAN
jgi:Flp pilus assembly protein TadG